MLGRPPLQISLARDAAFAVGLSLGQTHVRAALCDLGGGIVGDPFVADLDADPSAIVVSVIEQAGVATSRVIGVGVAHAHDTLPGWSGAAGLEERLGMPVQLRNDAHAGALGEHLFGAGRGVSDMVYLQLSARIGVGLIIDGRPFAGATGIAGEIGHSPVVENGMICRCGNRGCLETVAEYRGHRRSAHSQPGRAGLPAATGRARTSR